MATSFFRLPRLRFSLGALLLALTAAAAGLGLWWRLPWQIDHLPDELSKRRPTESPAGLLFCGNTGEDFTAVWDERVPYRKEGQLYVRVAAQVDKTVYAKKGKCWVRRDWEKPWVLDGAAEVFDGDGKRIIRAQFRNGKLHGDYSCWFTDGTVRETGKYWNGQKDSVWEERQFITGTVLAHAEYTRGQKSGAWDINGVREFYEQGKLVRQEWTGGEEGPERIMEFDQNEQLKEITYWKKNRTEQVGFDRYRAGEHRLKGRHGGWERICTFDNKAADAPRFVHRGSWTDDLPSGEWIYERAGGAPRRLQFEGGVLQIIDGKPACDLLMPKFSSLPENLSLKHYFLWTEDRKFRSLSRAKVLEETLSHSWPILHVDARLTLKVEELKKLLAEPLPDNAYYSQLPTTACLCLVLHDAGLALDMRHHALWLTTPQLAAEWRDETNTAPWFESIVNARPKPLASAKVVRDVFGDSPDAVVKIEDDGMDPAMMREIHFGSWQEAWERRQVMEFPKPLQCSQGIARRIDLNFDRSRNPADLLEREDYARRELDEQIAYACELYQCRLKLHGDTLVFEPRQASAESRE